VRGTWRLVTITLVDLPGRHTSGQVELLFEPSISCFIVDIELHLSGPSVKFFLERESSYRLSELVCAVIERNIQFSNAANFVRPPLFFHEGEAQIISFVDCIFR